MPFIGLTGGVGTGKTTVLRLFKKAGAYTIDADRIVHEVLKKPVIIKRLSKALGKDILIKRDSRFFINKKQMAEKIFNDAKKRRLAERIIHPEVMKHAEDIKKKILTKRPDRVIVFEVPLLFEAGYKRMFDKVIVVYTKKAVAIERLKRRGFSKDEALKRMDAQLPLSKKKAQADFLINNNSTVKDLEIQVQEIFNRLIY
jgi:dephospho-CoA kinase